MKIETIKKMKTEDLIKRMENAEDFRYDDEEIELSERLFKEGKTWRWKRDTPYGVNKIEIVNHF